MFRMLYTHSHNVGEILHMDTHNLSYIFGNACIPLHNGFPILYRRDFVYPMQNVPHIIKHFGEGALAPVSKLAVKEHLLLYQR